MRSNWYVFCWNTLSRFPFQEDFEMFKKMLLFYCAVMVLWMLSCAPSGEEPAEEGVQGVSPVSSVKPAPPEVTPTPAPDSSQPPQLLANSTVTTLAIGAEAQITVSGGTPPYTYTVTSGGGSVGSSGLYTAPWFVGSVAVRVTDAAGVVSEAPINVVQRERIVNGGAEGGEGFTCAILDDSSVKCWGVNNYGQLGLGDTQHRGDQTGEMGDVLLRVNLGTGRTAKAITAGFEHACALLDDNSVKCWGRNYFGQLGLGDTQDRGDQADELGDNPSWKAVDFGTGRTAKAITAGAYFNCALLDDNSVKCWGDNHSGALGIGDYTLFANYWWESSHVTNVGDEPNEMGDNPSWKAVDFGTGRTAKAITAGSNHACAILDDSSVKCWGRNDYGQLGRGDTEQIGDQAGELGDNPGFKAVNLGPTLKAKAITAGKYYTCALLDNDDIKCWGDNRYGALGIGDTNHRGDNAGEMGDALPRVDFEIGLKAKAISAGKYHHTCALLDDNSVKCWGYNGYGDLGLGTTASIGDAQGEIAQQAPVDLGREFVSGVVRMYGAKAIAVGGDHSCALLDTTGALKCWGRNNNGELGIGNTQRRGAGDSYDMGNNLPKVELGTDRAVHR